MSECEAFKTQCVTIMGLYELISKDEGYVINQLRTDDWFERLPEHFQKFKIAVYETEMTQNDKDSCELIIDSYEKYGLSVLFAKDIETAILSNDNAMKESKKCKYVFSMLQNRYKIVKMDCKK